jgi:hypothetical protein
MNSLLMSGDYPCRLVRTSEDLFPVIEILRASLRLMTSALGQLTDSSRTLDQVRKSAISGNCARA